MKSVLFQINNYKQKISFLLICLLMFFPMLEVKTNSKIILFFFIFSVVLNFKTGINSIKNAPIKGLVINSLFFLLLVVSIIYTSDKNTGFKIITRQLSFVLFPIIIFYFINLTKKQLIILAKLFVLANVLSVLYLCIKLSENVSILEVATTNFDFRSIINTGTYKDWHPTYISAFILTSIILLIEYCYAVTKKAYKASAIAIIIVLSLFLFMLNSRAVVYSYIIIIPIYLFIKTKTLKGRIIFLLLCIPFLVGFYYLLMNNFSLNYRLVLQLEKVYAWFTDATVSTSGIDGRYFINQCNTNLFLNNPFLGYGIGDVSYNLSNCYLDMEFMGLYDNNLNTHNNYFYLLLSGGLVTLFAFLVLIINNMVLSIKTKNYAYFFVLMLLIVVFLTETFFERLNGIIFFSAFNSLYYYYVTNSQKLNNEY